MSHLIPYGVQVLVVVAVGISMRVVRRNLSRCRWACKPSPVRHTRTGKDSPKKEKTEEKTLQLHSPQQREARDKELEGDESTK